MSASLRFATVLACLTLVLAAFAGGPGTSALLSDAHIAAGNISTDVDNDNVVTVDAIDESTTTSENTSADKETNGTVTNETVTNETSNETATNGTTNETATNGTTNETATNGTTNETTTSEPAGTTDESSDSGDDGVVQSLTDDESKADAEED